MKTIKLWDLSPEDFNEWRRCNDYPSLFKIFEENLPHFKEWLDHQELSTEIIFQHGLARFVSSEKPLLLCKYNNDGKYRLFDKRFKKLPSIRKAGWIVSEQEYHPYFFWLKSTYGEKKFKDTKVDFRISSWINGKPQFMKKHFLLDLGGVEVHSPRLAERLLDFTCLDDLKIIGAHNNTHLYLWHCSAIGLEICGGLAFLDIYKTKLWDSGYLRVKRVLSLTDGIFQDFHFRECELRIHASRSTLTRCSIYGGNFEASLEHSSLENFKFNAGRPQNNNFHSLSKFYATAKNLYSSVGNTAEAGSYFFEERKNSMLSLLFPKKSNREKWHQKNILSKIAFSIKSYIKFIFTLTDYLVWGFGEKPLRTIMFAVGLILFSALVFNFSSSSDTYNDGIKSLYFSIVTFVTLGYGDISQKEPWLQIFSSIEAFSGMVLMGLFLAGYASKSKQY